MALLSAVFLGGLALIAVPIWLHRLRAHSAEQKAFSSLFLMRRSEAPVNMQRRLQHLILLALRIALIVLVCLAFAEPLFELATPTEATSVQSDLIIVVDNSMSMAASTGARAALAEAKAQARNLVSGLPSGNRAAIIAAGQSIDLLTSLTDDRSQLNVAIASITQSSGRLSFDGLSGRLATAASALVDPGKSMELHVISDFQQSAMPDQFNALVANATFATTLHRVGDAAPNWSIQSMRFLEGVEQDAVPSRVQVTIASHTDEARQMSVGLYRTGQQVASQEVTFPADASRTANALQSVEFAVNLEAREPRVWRAQLNVDDALQADNEHFLAKPQRRLEALPIIARSERAYTYLAAAVGAALPRYQAALTQVMPAGAVPVIVVVDPGTLASDVAAGLTNFLQGGGAVLLTVGDNTRASGELALLELALDDRPLTQNSYGVVAADRTHPVLSDQAGWQAIRVFQAVQTVRKDSGQAILTLDDGTPLLVEHRIGTGRLMVLSTALDPQWSSLVVEPAFVGFMANVINYLAEDLLPNSAIVGQPFAIPTQSVQMFDEDGARVLGLSETVDRPAVRLYTPGIYEIRTPSRAQPLSVNVDARESSLEPAEASLLQAWQDATRDLQDTSQSEHNVEATNTGAPQQWALAPWLLLVLLLVICIECATANVFNRQARGVVA